jgi:hypothetical protein
VMVRIKYAQPSSVEAVQRLQPPVFLHRGSGSRLIKRLQSCVQLFKIIRLTDENGLNPMQYL